MLISDNSKAFYDNDYVKGFDVKTLKEWTGRVVTRNDGRQVVLNESTRSWKYLSNLRETHLLEDEEPHFDNYSEYLDAQIQGMIDQGVDFSKAKDDTLKGLAHKHAEVAKNKFADIENQPKNDNEAEKFFNNSLQKKRAEEEANASEEAKKKAEKAEKEIEDLTKNLKKPGMGA